MHYEKNQFIHVYECDHKKELNLYGILNYFQEAAVAHSQLLGWDRDTLLQKYGCVWIMIRMGLEIVKIPHYGQTVMIRTKPMGSSTFEYDRHYEVTDLEGNPMIRGASKWIVLNLETRSIIRAVDWPELQIFKSNSVHSPTSIALRKLSPPEQLDKIGERHVGYTSIDVNQHANNAQYANWIMDCFEFDDVKDKRIASFKINYLHEVLCGTNVSLFKGNKGSLSFYIEGRQGMEQQVAFQSEITFSNI